MPSHAARLAKMAAGVDDTGTLPSNALPSSVASQAWATTQFAAAGHTHPGGSQAFPVGSVFIGVVATNPATLLGYGTWAAFGTGRMLVGIDAGQTEFDTVRETGGAKSVTLTSAQSGLPQHTHIQDAHTHVQNAHTHVQNSFAPRIINSGTAGTVGVQGASSASNANASNAATTATNQNATAVNQNATATNQNVTAADAAQAHPNLPPYIVVYMWERTA